MTAPMESVERPPTLEAFEAWALDCFPEWSWGRSTSSRDDDGAINWTLVGVRGTAQLALVHNHRQGSGGADEACAIFSGRGFEASGFGSSVGLAVAAARGAVSDRIALLDELLVSTPTFGAAPDGGARGVS